ncbi:MAG: glycosyltransferase family 1 protein [Acidimicrobiales bacterium]
MTELDGPVAIDVSAVPAQPAGAGVYVVELVRAVAAAREVDLALVARRDDEARWQALAPAASVRATAPVRRPIRLAWEQSWTQREARRLQACVWHGPHYTLPLLLPLPRVVTVHDLTFFDNPEWHEKSKVAFFTRMIQLSVRRADVIVSVSERTAARLRDLLAPVAPVLAIPHGVDHARFTARPGPDELARLAGLGVHQPFVAFAGTVEPRKDLPGLIEAFDKVGERQRELSLVVAGRPGWGSDEVDAAVARSPHRDRIHLLGYVDDDVVPALFRQAVAVAYTPFAEGFGLPALEALACGAALVTTAGTPMADVAGDAALLVEPGSPGALAEALESLAAGGADIERMRAAGPAIAAPWTWARCASGHAAAYHLAAGAR